jgi:hypothetical protein
LGAWKEITHPKAKPVEIWKKACLNGSYPVLKLHISSLSMQLASYIPYLGFNLFVNLDEDSDSEQKKESVSKSDNEDSESKKSSGNESDNDGSASESENESESESEYENQSDRKIPHASSDLCPEQFPFLHKLGVHSEFMERLMQELIKFNGRNYVEYMQGNNHPGYLLPVPSLRSIEKYESAVKAKSTSFMDNSVPII